MWKQCYRYGRSKIISSCSYTACVLPSGRGISRNKMRSYHAINRSAPPVTRRRLSWWFVRVRSRRKVLVDHARDDLAMSRRREIKFRHVILLLNLIMTQRRLREWASGHPSNRTISWDFLATEFRPYSICRIWIQIRSESGFGFTGKSNGMDSWVLSEVTTLLFVYVCDTDVTSGFASESTSNLDSLDSPIRIRIRALNGRIHWIWKIWIWIRIRIRQIEYGLNFSAVYRY